MTTNGARRRKTRGYGKAAMLTATASVMLVAFIVSGSTKNNSHSGVQGTLPELVIPEGRTELAIPFEGGIFESVPLSSKVFKAQQQAIKRCMKDRGFTYTPINLEKLAATANRDMFSHTDREAAAETGFGVAEPVDNAWREREDGPNPASLGAMSESEYAAYSKALGYSEMEPGCKQEAMKEVLGAYEIDGRPLSGYETELHNDAISFVRHSPEYMKALDTWKACLKESGIEAHHPAHLSESTKKARPSPNEVTAEEKKIAVLHVDCVNRANLINVQNGVMKQAEEWLVSQNHDLFVAVAQMKRTAENNTASQ